MAGSQGAGDLLVLKEPHDLSAPDEHLTDVNLTQIVLAHFSDLNYQFPLAFHCESQLKFPLQQHNFA